MLIKFEEYFKLYENIDSTEDAIEIDLDSKESKIEVGKKYAYLGLVFRPNYMANSMTEPYMTILRRPGIEEGAEKYWGKVITAKTLEELQKEIRVEAKLYIQENP